MRTRGVYTAAAFAMVAAVANGVMGVWYIVTDDEGWCSFLWNGPWYDDDVIQPTNWCHDLGGVTAIADGVLWILVAYFSIVFAPTAGPTTTATTLPNGAGQKVCVCL
jgi:hypothetical protein